MVVASFSSPASGAERRLAPVSHSPAQLPVDWAQLLIAGTLVAGGAMIVTGHRRAGTAVAAAGAALALIEEQDVIVEWWKKLPEFLGQAQGLLDRVEHYVEEASTQGSRIQSILRR
jgi:hypothetical protein